MAYLKYFKEVAQYESYISGSPILPNVSMIKEDSSMKYNPYVAPVVTSITVNSFTYNPEAIPAIGGTAAPSVTYTINYSDGSTATTGGSISYAKNSGDATIDTSTGVLTWTANTTTGELTTNVTVTVSKDSINGTLTGDSIQTGIHNVGDICYWNGHRLAYTPYTSWSASMGTALAVCVIPTTHNVYKNGNAGFVSVQGIMSSAGTEEEMIKWGPSGYTPLTNYTKVPTWDNTISGTTGISTTSMAYISVGSNDASKYPVVNAIDSGSRYDKTPIQYSYDLIPSPYLADGSLNTAYTQTLEGNNALSDFNGSGNTAILVGLGNEYIAANVCHSYSAVGLSAGSWYLPAKGEMTYISPRLNVINSAITAVNGVIFDYMDYWTSTEYGDEYVHMISIIGGYCDAFGKIDEMTKEEYEMCLRPFISLP